MAFKRTTSDPRTGNLIPEQAPIGAFDKWSFIAERDGLKFRCPNCNKLMDSDFSYEKHCPNCNKYYTKKEWSLMYAEAIQVNVMGGWTHEKLESLGRLNSSGYVNKDNVAKPVNDVMLNVVKAVEANRRAGIELINALRNMSSVSQKLKKRPL